jgi:photosystem II stability/assembly factor-like uncharacterized protein
MERNKLLVGTGKGLVIFQRQHGNWKIEKSLFIGMPVSYVYVDERTDEWWVSITHRHWGQKLHHSKDRGQTWKAIPMPKYPADAKLKSGKAATLRKIWAFSHAGNDRPGELYLGTEPGGMFHSKDNGQTFQLMDALWNHPTRQDQWFGAGRDHPFIHSIVVDPRDSNHFYIAISCAGVFETTDGGINWKPKNKGLVAAYLPNPNVEVGHDPHLLLACDSNPDIMWQQNHCGIFRTTNGGEYWDNVTGQDGFPNYGFALAIEDDQPDMAWVIPATSDEMRVAVDLSLCVCRTDDGGKTWTTLRKGLPQGNCFDIVFRHSFAKAKGTLAFGTTTGNLFLSHDYGDSWEVLSNYLPRVECVAFA